MPRPAPASPATHRSDAPDFDDGALLAPAPPTEQERDDDDTDAGHDHAGLGRALGDFRGVVGDAADLGELRLDVGAGDGLVVQRDSSVLLLGPACGPRSHTRGAEQQERRT